MFNKKFISMIIALAMLITNILPAYAASYEYDALGRLVNVDYNESKKADYSYDAGGNIKNVAGFAAENSTETTTDSSTETTTEQPTESSISEYIWNYTDNTNTDVFFTVSAKNWSNAVPVNYGDLTLTKAVKMETSSSITFTAIKAGTLSLVTYSTNSNPSVLLNGENTAVSANGLTEIEISAEGIYTITKNTTNTYLYYISFKYNTDISEKISYTWNYTDNTNTDGFFTVNASNWSNAVAVNYGDLILTKAVKMETGSSITFTAAKAGTLSLVTYSTKSNPTVSINGMAYTVSANGNVIIPLTEETTYNITKGTTNTYLYYLKFTEE